MERMYPGEGTHWNGEAGKKQGGERRIHHPLQWMRSTHSSASPQSKLLHLNSAYCTKKFHFQSHRQRFLEGKSEIKEILLLHGSLSWVPVWSVHAGAVTHELSKHSLPRCWTVLPRLSGQLFEGDKRFPARPGQIGTSPPPRRFTYVFLKWSSH